MSESVDGEPCYYFGFGSNMSTERIHINCPSAQFVTTAQLSGYALRFVETGSMWHGATATLCAEEGAVTWGVLWKISQEHLASLDKQEGSCRRRLMTTVTSQSGEEYKCHAYQVKEPITFGDPSPPYLHTIISGAKEHYLPEDYIAKLTSQRDNGYQGEYEVP